MQQMLKRDTLQEKVRLCLSEAPVTVLLGAHQTGETTLARLLAEEYSPVRFFDLERPASRADRGRRTIIVICWRARI